MAHRHAARNRAEIARSLRCACFQCLAWFPATDIVEWIYEDTALCPRCCVDAVLGDASGLLLRDEFLRAMNAAWFGTR